MRPATLRENTPQRSVQAWAFLALSARKATPAAEKTVPVFTARFCRV